MGRGGNYNKFNEWRSHLLSQRGLKHPDGRPLYLYRLHDNEFEALEQRLRNVISLFLEQFGLAKIARLAAFDSLFVLYAAEWWRRRYDGSGFSWEPILRDLGAGANAWTPSERSEFVHNGLRAWRIEPRRAGALRFLGTVAVQGGLPLKLLASARGGIGRLLSRVLKLASRDPCTEEDIGRWVESLNDMLPKSYRRAEIYVLLADVAWAVLQLKSEAEITSSTDAVSLLDVRVPNWRDRFPLPVDDEHAQRLIEQLIRDVADIRLERRKLLFPVERYIAVDNGIYGVLHSRISIPRHVPDQDLAKLFGVAADEMPRTAELLLKAGRQTLSVSMRRLSGRNVYRLETCLWDILGADALAEHILRLVAPDGRVWSAPAEKGQAVDQDLPWVFVEEGSELHLFRQGSGSVPQVRAVVALPAEWRWNLPVESVLLPFQLPGQERRFYQVSAAAVAAGPEGLHFRLRLGDAGSTEESYLWHGNRVWLDFISPAMAFRGMPRLHRINEEGLSKRVDGEPAVTVIGAANRNLALGPVVARYPASGDIKARSRMVVLESQSELRLQPGDSRSGKICLRGWKAESCRAVTLGLAQSFNKQDGDLELWLEAPANEMPPGTIELEVFWAHTPHPVKLRVPFPARGVRAFDATGEELTNGAIISVRQIIGTRVVVTAAGQAFAATLELSFPGSGIFRRYKLKHSSGTGSVELRLQDYLDDILPLLSVGGSLDSTVQVELLAQGGSQFALSIARYAASLEKQGCTVGLTTGDLRAFSDAELQAFTPQAIRLEHPEDEPVSLTPILTEGVHTGRWEFLSPEREPGSWLIYPSADTEVPLRATIWFVVGEMDSTPGLCSAIHMANPDIRIDAIMAVLDQLAEDFTHPDWLYVEQLLSHVKHLPLATLDIWRCFARSDKAMAAFALRFGSITWDFVVRFARELPFAWEAVSMAAWRNAARQLEEQCCLQMGNEAGASVMRIYLKERVDALVAFSPALSYLLGIVAAPYLEEFRRESGVLPFIGSGAEKRLFHDEDSLLMSLRRAHANDDWPTECAEVMGVCEEKASYSAYLHEFEPKFQKEVANLPLLLAAQVANNQTSFWFQDPTRVHTLKTCQAFSPDWFDEAFNLTIARCLADGLLDKK